MCLLQTEEIVTMLSLQKVAQTKKALDLATTYTVLTVQEATKKGSWYMYIHKYGANGLTRLEILILLSSLNFLCKPAVSASANFSAAMVTTNLTVVSVWYSL